MNDVNDKLIEGLEEQRKRIADLEDDLATQVGHTEMIRNNHCKVSIVNDWTDMCADDKPPKMIKVDDWYYAFIKDEHGYALWINDENDDLSPSTWGEVSDLTGVPVWVYQELKSYAVAIGWKTEDQDLFI